MDKLPLSVFIIAVNEGDRIAQSIESVRGFADEIIVIDSGSIDDTVQASQAAGARVIHHDWLGYGLQKRFGEDQCRNDWLLNIDADEVVSPALADEIRALFAMGVPTQGGFTMRIMEILPGRKKPGPFGHHVTAVRLYNRKCGRFSDSLVHDSVIMEKGAVGALKNIVEHRSSRGLTHSIDKVNRYSTMQAENMARGRPPTFPTLRLLIEFPAGFIKAYFFRGYVFEGRAGFVNSMLYGFSRFVRLAKYLERSD